MHWNVKYFYVQIHITIFKKIKHINIYTSLRVNMGWLRLVGSLKLWVSFVKEPYKRDYVLQKRPIILRSLIIVATPYVYPHTCVSKYIHVYAYIYIGMIYIYVNIWWISCTHTFICICVHIRICTYTHTHINIQIHLSIDLHMRIHWNVPVIFHCSACTFVCVCEYAWESARARAYVFLSLFLHAVVDLMYGVATISRLLQIIGLLCKRAL